MLLDLLPSGAAGASAGPDDWRLPLHPEEWRYVEHAAERRRREFAAGRACGRRALARLGERSVAIARGAHREPCWPVGVVGSITHCPGYCVAAVARVDCIRGIGIDAERNRALRVGARRLVCHPDELAHVRKLDGVVDPAVLIFSAKESVYKAWFALTGTQLGFHDARIALDPTSATFCVEIDSAVDTFALASRLLLTGRYAASREHVFTVVTVAP